MEPAHGIGLYSKKLAAHEFREWGGKQDCGVECFQQDVLTKWYGLAVRKSATRWASEERSISYEAQRTSAGSAVAPRSSIVLIVGKASQVKTIFLNSRLVR